MTMHTDPSDVRPTLMSPLKPHAIVLVGATGDLARRKLIPGLLHLSRAGLLADFRIVGTSLDDVDVDGFRKLAREACDDFGKGPITEDEWSAFEARLGYVGQESA